MVRLLSGEEPRRRESRVLRIHVWSREGVVTLEVPLAIRMVARVPEGIEALVEPVQG